MGELISEIVSQTNKTVQVDRFSGGVSRGVCIQLTQGDAFVQLTMDQAAHLGRVLLLEVAAFEKKGGRRG